MCSSACRRVLGYEEVSHLAANLQEVLKAVVLDDATRPHRVLVGHGPQRPAGFPHHLLPSPTSSYHTCLAVLREAPHGLQRRFRGA